jgi:carboxymethylenebutenolidase
MSIGEGHIPAEAVEFYTQFIHGEIGRRAFASRLRRYAAALIEALMPNYALGQQVRRDDERIEASYETIPSPDGNGHIRGYLVRPFSADHFAATPAKLPGVIHAQLLPLKAVMETITICCHQPCGRCREMDWQ